MKILNTYILPSLGKIERIHNDHREKGYYRVIPENQYGIREFEFYAQCVSYLNECYRSYQVEKNRKFKENLSPEAKQVLSRMEKDLGEKEAIRRLESTFPKPSNDGLPLPRPSRPSHFE